MCHSGVVDDTTWGALALVLTLTGGGYTYWAFTHRGAAAGTRGAALTVLPVAAWLTGTLRMFTRILDAVLDWATSLVLSPLVWLGIGLAGLSVVLWVVAGFLGSRTPDAKRPRRSAPAGRRLEELPAARRPESGPVVRDEMDDEMDEIQAILRKRGIS